MQLLNAGSTQIIVQLSAEGKASDRTHRDSMLLQSPWKRTFIGKRAASTPCSIAQQGPTHVIVL